MPGPGLGSGPGPGGSGFDAFGGSGSGSGGSTFDAFGGPGPGSAPGLSPAPGSGDSDFDAFGARSSGFNAFGSGAGGGLGDPGPGDTRFGDPAFEGTAFGGQGSGDPRDPGGHPALGGPVPAGPVPEGPGGPGADPLAPIEGQAPTVQGPGEPGAPGTGGRRAGESPDGTPKASRVTTAILVTVLVLVVLITGVLGTIAVLMTRNPDMPLGGTPPKRLAVPLHFAPVTEAKPGACTAPETYPDDLGQTCYSVEAGINVNAVRKIEAIQEKSGAYSVRIAFAPAFREQINDLTAEAVDQEDPVRQQIAIVVGDKVVAAPRVAQAITDDSLSIAGSFTKEEADAMVVRLLGSGAVVPQPAGTQPTPSVFTPPDGATTPPPADQQQPVNPPASQPASAPANQPVAPPNSSPATNPITTNTAGTDANRPADTTGDSSANASGEGTDRRFPTCKAARENGNGPYTRGVHEEYQWYIDGDGDGVACEQAETG
ncbi:excalibur calcium-binding domain-containing protein [Streptosporangium sp. NPDC002524]|uniref:excalibur calcium-binding domain-containing protein n=1 Tax=Streptosporangium sp. NPDC002524 TaxID=3154537 RepID=UPI00331B5AC0